MSNDLSKILEAVGTALCLAGILSFGLSDRARAGKAPSWLETVPVAEGLEAFPEEETVQLLRWRRVVIEESGRRRVVEREVYHLREGDGEGSTVRLFFESHWRKLESMQGWRRTRDGALEEYDQLARTQLFGGELYSEDHEVSLSIPGAPPGSLLAFETESSDRMDELASDMWEARENLPVVRWSYELVSPESWEAQGFWLDPMDGSALLLDPETPLPHTRSWTRSDIPGPAEPEPYQPPDDGLIPTFCLRYTDPKGRAARLTDWRSVSAWFQNYSLSALSDQGQLAPVSRQILEGTETNQERIVSIADFVRNSISYVQIYLRDGGYRPHATAEVVRNRFGDCKDMAHLAMGLFRSNGIPAYAVLANPSDHHKIWPGFPTPFQFNHCIVAVGAPNEFLFFDPTAKGVPLGRLPASLEGTWALVTGCEADTGLIRLPASRSEENQFYRTAHLSLNSDLVVSGEVEELRVGQPAFGLRASLQDLSPQEFRDHWQSRLEERFGGAKVLESSSPDLFQVGDSLRVQYRFEIAAAATRAGKQVLIQPDFFTARRQRLFDDETRTAEIDFGYPYCSETTVELRWPEGWRLASLPESVSVENDFGSYRRSHRLAGSELVLHRAEQVRVARLPSASYALAVEWDRACYRADRERVVVMVP